MRKLANLLMSGAVSLCMLAPAATQAATLVLVTYTDRQHWQSHVGATASWNQELSPTPIASALGEFTDVPITNFTASPFARFVARLYADISWFSNVQFVTGIAGGFRRLIST